MNSDKYGDKYNSHGSSSSYEWKTCPSDYYSRSKDESSWDKGWDKAKDTVSSWFSDKK